MFCKKPGESIIPHGIIVNRIYVILCDSQSEAD